MNTKPSVKSYIKTYLEEKGGWIAGGTLERNIGAMAQCKNSNVGRRCRELEDAGVIESRYVTVPGVFNKIVEYRLKKPDVTQWFKGADYGLKDNCCFSFYRFKVHAKDCQKQNEHSTNTKIPSLFR